MAGEAKQETFESALGSLEDILEEMEGDQLPLDRLIERYEEGVRLVKHCADRLNHAEKRIELITSSATDDASPASTKPFDATEISETPEAPIRRRTKGSQVNAKSAETDLEALSPSADADSEDVSLF